MLAENSGWAFPAYAGQLFKRDTQLGVRKYAKKQRFLKAAERIAATELPIKMIAAEFGYRQASDFTRFFREQCLLNPMTFRKQIG